ncbi:hypothetical protein ACFUGD_06650 [Streptomyces sp. NPDC057217]|uniref:hypothetical protein n=1 Tax=Streptomyces sp. NPDC057217 TaxID=3346054 RepID=UPI003624CA6E
MATLTSPVKGYTGAGPGGVVFTDGHAETDNPAVIAYARRQGYGVTEDEQDDAGERPARSAVKAEWLAYAQLVDPETTGLDELTKEQLVERYGSEE